MAENWNLSSVEPLDDANYFLWSEKIEGILRTKKLWKKVIGMKPPEKPEEDDAEYAAKFKVWNEWDDNNYAARTVMINTMSKAQLLKYTHEKNADKLWSLIKNNMAAETEQLRARSLDELTNLRMNKEESVDAFVNRAEALKNQCIQLGKNIEDYELKMYIIRGLRAEFDQNVRVLETQKELTVNDIRYALKQEEMRKSKRKEEKRDSEHVRKARERSRLDICCYNCGTRGHTSRECHNKQKCFKCQGFNHIAADCKEPMRNVQRGRGNRGYNRGKGYGRGREVTLKTSDEAVMTVRDTAQAVKEEKQVKLKNCLWLLDSGATSHMVSDEIMFDKIEEDERNISLADSEGKKLTSTGKGEIVINQSSNDDRIRLKNVLCVPGINMNLMSVAKITDYGFVVKFDKHGAIVYRNEGEIEMKAVREENAYYVRSSLINNKAAAARDDLDVWHKRLGHANKKTIEDMMKEDLVTGMKKSDVEKRQCKPCVEGKMCKKTHLRLEGRKTIKIMDLWHIDLIGPIKPLSRGGKRYIFTIIDDYSRVIFVELLEEKGDAADKLKKLILLKENQTGQKLKALRSDNGGEFIGIDLQEWLKEKGIKHEFSPPRTPQCNGVVERANRSIIEMTRAMMSDSEMPNDFWAEAVCTAVHIRNRIKSRVHGRTPFEVWNSRKPNMKYLRRFGCVAYLLDKEGGRKKFDSKTTKGIFVGYAANHAYRVFVPETGRIKTDCDVKFDESRRGYEMLNEEEKKNQINYDKLIIVGLDGEDGTGEMQQEEIEEDVEEGKTESESTEYENAETEEFEQETQHKNENDSDEDEDIEDILVQSMKVRSRGRPKGTTKAMIESRKRVIEKERRQERENVRRSERIKGQQKAMLVVDEEIPKTVEEAKKLINWRYWKQAMGDELASMMKHNVWNLVPRPRDMKVIKNKWIFDIKEDGTEQRRYKARLVALGCGQRPGLDYGETYAPVMRTETFRVLISIGAQERRKLKNYDVKTAFLHGTLEEDIFMELPDGIQDNQDKVCKLKKSIYGLKQAGRCWNDYMTKIMIKSGLRQSKEDPCLFFEKRENRFMYCGIHVDDMLVVSSDNDFEKIYMDKIKQHVDIKDLGEAKTMLGMQIVQEEDRVFVHQKKYIEKLLTLYGMENCNPVTSPIDVNTKMDECEESNMTEIKAYQELLGRLMYISICTRPDLSFALSCLSQFNSEPRVTHMASLKRILRYLKGTMDYRLEYRKKGSIQMIECETDASWDRTKDAKSFSGMLLYWNGDLIQWRSRKQLTVALSTTEGEMEAMLEGLKEVVWARNLIQEITSTKIIVKELRSDNLNAVRLANGGNYKAKSKLLNRKCHYIQETVNEESILVRHVPSEEMTADCLTKPLSGPTLLKNVLKFMDTGGQ